MFKKTLLVTAIVAASTGIAFANGGTYTPPAPVHTHNIYIGAAVSRDFLSNNISVSDEEFDNFDGVSLRNAVAHSADLGDDGWNGELFAGLGFTFMDHYYLAGELFGDVSSTEVSSSANFTVFNTTVSSFDADVKSRYSFGIRAIPGVKISDSTMLYGAVGAIWTNFKATFSGVSLANGVTDFGPFSENKTRLGLQLGLGMETMITNNCSARIEYDWNRYGNNTFLGEHPHIDQAKLGLAYHFMSV